MDEALEKKLYKKYPKLFVHKDLPIQETCMCWGLCVNSGWYWLIDNLCGCIQGYIDNNNKKQVEVIQVKEKFGQLRFYVIAADYTVYGMIALAEEMSYRICENCGAITDIIQTKGCIKTLCKSCNGEK